MAMQLASADADGDDEMNATINTTPLVDVMLVLLIIFLITVPVVTASVPVRLPQERNQPTRTRPDNIVIAVDRDGELYWGNERLAGAGALLARLKAVATATPQPEVHIRGDAEARYESVGRVVLAAQRAGIHKVGFITEPGADSAKR